MFTVLSENMRCSGSLAQILSTWLLWLLDTLNKIGIEASLRLCQVESAWKYWPPPILGWLNTIWKPSNYAGLSGSISTVFLTIYKYYIHECCVKKKLRVARSMLKSGMLKWNRNKSAPTKNDDPQYKIIWTSDHCWHFPRKCPNTSGSSSSPSGATDMLEVDTIGINNGLHRD